ncbi:hypothetical protein V1477_000219, partial [Vespula maculifrons]
MRPWSSKSVKNYVYSHRWRKCCFRHFSRKKDLVLWDSSKFAAKEKLVLHTDFHIYAWISKQEF